MDLYLFMKVLSILEGNFSSLENEIPSSKNWFMIDWLIGVYKATIKEEKSFIIQYRKKKYTKSTYLSVSTKVSQTIRCYFTNIHTNVKSTADKRNLSWLWWGDFFPTN
jgi:hypothetical protein